MRTFNSLIRAAERNRGAERVYIPVHVWERMCDRLFEGGSDSACALNDERVTIASMQVVEGIKIYLVDTGAHIHEEVKFV